MQHEVGHGDLNHCDAAGHHVLVIVAPPPVIAQPAERAFDDPTFRQHHQSPSVVAASNDLDLTAQPLGDLLEVCAGVAAPATMTPPLRGAWVLTDCESIADTEDVGFMPAWRRTFSRNLSWTRCHVPPSRKVSEVVVHARPRPEVPRQYPPRVARTVDVEDSVDHLPHLDRAWSAAGQRLGDRINGSMSIHCSSVRPEG